MIQSNVFAPANLNLERKEQGEFFFFFWLGLVFELGLCAYKAGTLPLEPTSSYFGDGVLKTIF
jgi:hypothetical protein